MSTHASRKVLCTPAGCVSLESKSLVVLGNHPKQLLPSFEDSNANFNKSNFITLLAEILLRVHSYSFTWCTFPLQIVLCALAGCVSLERKSFIISLHRRVFNFYLDQSSRQSRVTVQINPKSNPSFLQVHSYSFTWYTFPLQTVLCILAGCVSLRT